MLRPGLHFKKMMYAIAVVAVVIANAAIVVYAEPPPMPTFVMPLDGTDYCKSDGTTKAGGSSPLSGEEISGVGTRDFWYGSWNGNRFLQANQGPLGRLSASVAATGPSNLTYAIPQGLIDDKPTELTYTFWFYRHPNPGWTGNPQEIVFRPGVSPTVTRTGPISGALRPASSALDMCVYAIYDNNGVPTTTSELGKTATVPADQWVHIAMRVSAPENKMAIYMNGVKQSESAIFTGKTILSLVAYGSTMYIGRTGTVALQQSPFALSDFRMYHNKALTDAEIQALAGLTSPTLTLAASGRSLAIVYNDGTTNTDAAWLTREQIKYITGVTGTYKLASQMDTPQERAQYQTRIWIGRQPEVESVFGSELNELDADGYLVRVVGDDVYLAGNTYWTDQWAVYDFFERFVGYRIYGPYVATGVLSGGNHPIGIFEEFKQRSSIAVVREVHRKQEPGYRARLLRGVPTAFRIWQGAAGHYQRDWFSHNFYNIFPWATYANPSSQSYNPNLYPLINGVRQVPPSSRPYDFQPCVGNQDVEDITVNYILNWFTAWPLESSCSVGMNDSIKHCECSACMSVVPPTITDRDERMAYAFFQFYNRVASRVAQSFPDKKLGCLAYMALDDLPAGSMTLDSMIAPYVTLDSAQLFDSNVTSWTQAKLSQWFSLAPSNLCIYEYMYGAGFAVPRLYDRYLFTNICNKYGGNADGFYAEVYPNWGLDGWKYWLTAKLLWDPAMDPDELKKEWCTALFGAGAAGGKMLDFFNYLENAWCTQTLTSNQYFYRWYLDPKQLEIFPPATVDYAWTLLTDAESAAQGNSLVLARIAYFKDTFRVTWCLSKRHSSVLTLKSLAANPSSQLSELLHELGIWLNTEDPAYLRSLLNSTCINMTDLSLLDSVPFDEVAYLIKRVTDTAIASLQQRTEATICAAIELLIDTAAGTDSYAMDAAEFLKPLACDTGFLIIPQGGSAPTIDGTISSGEWPTAVFSGNLFTFKKYSLDHYPQETDLSTMYARQVGNMLYVAFDLQQTPSTIGGHAYGLDSGGYTAPQMVNDDAIVINIKPLSGYFQGIRVNPNNAIGYLVSDWPNVVTAHAVTATSTGWQVEMAINTSLTSLANYANSTVYLPITRYKRYKLCIDTPAALSNTTLGVSMLMPVGSGLGMIGVGNHPTCMSFSDGPRIIPAQ